MTAKPNPQDIYGNIDIYLFDQLLKGTYANCNTILDAGCGSGRNLIYFMNSGYEVYGIYRSEEAISQLRTLSLRYPLIKPEDNFRVSTVEDLPFENEKFDLVISSAVLHFAENLEHFEAMLDSMWRVIKCGGFFLQARLRNRYRILSSFHRKWHIHLAGWIRKIPGQSGNVAQAHQKAGRRITRTHQNHKCAEHAGYDNLVHQKITVFIETNCQAPGLIEADVTD